MKWRSRILHLLLILAIIVSIILSAGIWLSVGRVESKGEDVRQTVQRRNQQALALADQVFYHQSNRVVMQSKESTTKQVMNDLKKTHYKEVKHSIISFGKLRTIKRGVTLSYLSPISFNTFSDIFGLKFDKSGKQNFEFTQLVYDVDNRQLLFANERSGSVHCFQAIDDNPVLKKDIQQVDGIPVTYINDTLGYVPEKEMSLSCYSYMSATQSYNIYTQAFFVHPDEVTADNTEQGVTLYNTRGDHMELDNETSEVTYDGEFSLSEGENRFLKVMDMMSRLGNEPGKLRYFDQNHDGYQYKVFVEGYPIMGAHYQGQVTVNIHNNQIKIKTSQEIPQIPVPSHKKVTLPSGKDLLEECDKNGVNPQQIKKIQIGYHWSEDKDDKQVIILTPTWYVFHDQKWQSIDDIKEEGKTDKE